MATAGVLEFEMTLGPQLTAEEAAAIFARGEEAVIFALLKLAKGWAQAEGQCAAVSSPARPSGMTPVHHKPATRKRGQKPGRKAGHPGSRRAPPERIDFNHHLQFQVTPGGLTHQWRRLQEILFPWCFTTPASARFVPR